jgi:membrane protease YdiL (CAAX protease family)
MTDRKVLVQFTLLTFGIAYLVSGILIALKPYGYTVHNWVNTLPQFAMNVPFSIYILSPAIACYIVLKRNKKITGLKEWLRTVFYIKNSPLVYLFAVAGLALYFSIHLAVAGEPKMTMPFYMILFYIPGSLMIGGLEEAGWMYILQPGLDKKYGYLISSLAFGFLWALWHIPLFFLPGTNHGDGLINFWMFTVQLIAFRFFHGALYRISGKGWVFMSVLFHTLFNATSPLFGTMTMTWTGTILANAALVLVSIGTVAWYEHKRDSRLRMNLIDK